MVLSKKIGYILGAIVTLCQAELLRYELNITSGIVNPDCHTEGFNVPHINGQFPGPTLYAQIGDEVEVLVRNQMENFNTSIHYHGIRQIGSVESDGVPGVTQHAIYPGTSYLQKFQITDQAGTYFYHAHTGLQDDSVQGSFIVYESDSANPKKSKSKTLKAGPYEYKKDLTLQLSEWFHEELDSRQDYYYGDKFRFDHGAQSILMNGRTVHDPETVDEKTCEGYTTFDVEPNTTYRLRLIGANSFRTFALGIKDHNMTMIEVDGELVHPYNTSFLEITPGQRFSVLLKTGDHAPGSTFAIGTSYLWRQRGRGITENGFGYIRYVEAETNKEKDENNTHLLKTIKKWKDVRNIGKRAEWVGGERTETDEHRVDRSEKSNEDDKEGRRGGRGRPDSGNDKQAGQGGRGEEGGRGGPGGRGGQGGREDRGGAEQGGQGGGRGGQGGPGGPGGGGRGGGGGGGRGGKAEKVYLDLPVFPNLDEPDWVWHQIKPLAPRNPIVDEMDVRTIKLHTTHVKMHDNTTRYMVNKRLLPMMRAAPLVRHQNLITNHTYTTDDQQYNSALDTYRVSHNEIVDFVFQNTRNEIGGCLLHPWHTHGHSHYVIASGPGDYIHEEHKDIRNFEHPLFKDTTVAYPSIPTDDTDGCGWTKVRIIADNPGYWAVHCHITTHMIQGKMIVIEEAPEMISTLSRYNRIIQ